MKRYVREFANDVLRLDDVRVKRGEIEHPAKAGIDIAVRMCDRGMITDKEAVRAILNIDFDCRDYSWERGVNHESVDAVAEN